jgi:ABC-type glycerol-3-phosphate transport system permease component
VATITVLITLILSLFGSYALARFNFPGKNFGIVFLVFPLLPPAAILVPLVSYVNRLGLYDTLAAVILINMVFNLPFAVWMLRNFVLTNPIEVEEAAYLDGCSHVAVLWRIAIPSMAPGLIAVAVFVFINSWNNYLYAFALTASQSLRVLPQGIFAFLGTWGTYWGGLSAAGILTLIPPVAMFLVFHKWFIAGLLGAQLR